MILAALILCTASKTAEPVLSTRYFTYSICSLPDINGDGVPDLAFGLPVDEYVWRDEPYAPNFKSAGHVWIVSGKDGSELKSLRPESGDNGFGIDVCVVEHNDKPEVWTLAVGPDEKQKTRLALYVFDPVNGSLERHLIDEPLGSTESQPFFVAPGMQGNAPRLPARPWIACYDQIHPRTWIPRTWPEQTCDWARGYTLEPWQAASWASARDATHAGDELDTLAALNTGQEHGLLAVWTNGAAASTRPLRASLALDPQTVLREWMSAGPDLDGDGVPDLALVVRHLATREQNESVMLVSGKELEPIREIPVMATWPAHIESLAFVGDEDGDGLAELAIGVPGFVDPRVKQPSGTYTGVAVFSSKTGELRWAHASNFIGARVLPAHDFDHDGIADLIAGRGPVAGQSSPEECRAEILSGKDGAMILSLVVERDHLNVTLAHH